MKQELINKLNCKLCGTKVIEYDEIESTQLEAHRLAENGIENGTIILAKNQTMGIGTHDRKWHSGEKNKNIIFTLIMYPNCSISKLTNITKKIAQCMIEAIKQYTNNVELEIKEPNDILCNKKKLGGILTQTVTKGETVKYLLIGIGVNINQEVFPTELKEIATSLKIETNKEYNKIDILSEFLNKFEKIYTSTIS